MTILSAPAPNLRNLLPPRRIALEPASAAVELRSEARQTARADCTPSCCEPRVKIGQLRVDSSEIFLFRRSFGGESPCRPCWCYSGERRCRARQRWLCSCRSWRALAGQWRLLWPRGEALRGA